MYGGSFSGFVANKNKSFLGGGGDNPIIGSAGMKSLLTLIAILFVVMEAALLAIKSTPVEIHAISAVVGLCVTLLILLLWPMEEND